MTARAEVGRRTDSPVKLATTSSAAGLWPTRASVAMDSGVATRPIADFDAYIDKLTEFVYKTNLFSPLLTNNLGWGIPGMVVTNDSFGAWYGDVRVLLTEP